MLETALAKVQAAEDAWNSRDPARVSMAYTEARLFCTQVGEEGTGAKGVEERPCRCT